MDGAENRQRPHTGEKNGVYTPVDPSPTARAHVRARLADWFDIIRAGLQVDGVTQQPVMVTPDQLKCLFDASPSQFPAVDSHADCFVWGKRKPRSVGRVGAIRFDPEGEAIQARLDMVRERFVDALALGDYFGRSVTIKDGRIVDVAFCTARGVPGAAGNRPLHFLHPDAFADREQYERRKRALEVTYVAHADRARRMITGWTGRNGKPRPWHPDEPVADV